MAEETSSKDENEEQEEVVDINLSDLDFDVFSAERVQARPAVVKETAAKWIGIGLLVIFGSAIGIILIAYFLIVDLKNPEQLKEFTNSLVALLKAISEFSSAVFTPLLAFVLGYYFAAGKSKEGRD